MNTEFPNTPTFVFIIKSVNADINDPNYIAIFNHKYIWNYKSPLHSNLGAPHTTRIGYNKISLTKPYDDIKESIDLIKFSYRWVEKNKFIPLWVSGSGLIIKSFKYYIDFFRLVL